MKYGIIFANTMRWSNGEGAVASARAADAAGFESMWTVEHVIYPDDYSSPYPYSPDGKTIYSACGDRTFRAWDAATGRELFTHKGHTTDVWCLAVSTDGQVVVTGGRDGMLKTWDARTGQEMIPLKGHAGGVAGVAIAPDGKRIASVGLDRTLRFWDAP